MFFHPLPLRDDVIINAGELGRYRFSEDTHTYNASRQIRIRPELVDLLNELQAIFKYPMLITSGHRSQQHQIYLWARWLDDRPAEVRTLNKKNYPTWAEWVNASQGLLGCPSLRSKHQTGDAVNFYCGNVRYWLRKSSVNSSQDSSAKQAVSETIPLKNGCSSGFLPMITICLK